MSVCNIIVTYDSVSKNNKITQIFNSNVLALLACVKKHDI